MPRWNLRLDELPDRKKAGGGRVQVLGACRRKTPFQMRDSCPPKHTQICPRDGYPSSTFADSFLMLAPWSIRETGKDIRAVIEASGEHKVNSRSQRETARLTYLQELQEHYRVKPSQMPHKRAHM